jgi:hypothetical protein
MNRARWLSLGFVILFMAVAIGVPAWKEYTGQVGQKHADGIYAAFALLCMGLICIWWSDTAAPEAEAEEPTEPPQEKGEKRRSVKSLGWLLLTLSIVIATIDMVR